MSDSLVGLLAERERQREQYWQKRDPILADRLLWRAQTLRHMVHLLPGQAILELGCGTGQSSPKPCSMFRVAKTL